MRMWGLCVAMLAAWPVWAEELVLRALMSGEVVQQAVSSGDRVRAGQLLMVIDPALWQAQVAKVRAQIKARQADLEDARLDLMEAEDLYDRAVLAKRVLQRAQKKVVVAQAALNEAQAALQGLKAQKKYFYIRAPRAGVVRSVKAPQGVVALYGMPLVVLEVSDE